MTRAFLATTSAGLRRAAFVSGAWTVAAVATGHDVRCLAVDAVQPLKVFAGTTSGLLRSLDGGVTWIDSGLEHAHVKALSISRAEPGRMLAGTKPPLVYLSDDGGRSWSELEAFRANPISMALVLTRRMAVHRLCPGPGAVGDRS